MMEVYFLRAPQHTMNPMVSRGDTVSKAFCLRNGENGEEFWYAVRNEEEGTSTILRKRRG